MSVGLFDGFCICIYIKFIIMLGHDCDEHFIAKGTLERTIKRLSVPGESSQFFSFEAGRTSIGRAGLELPRWRGAVP